jgi:replicative DNA helicase
VSITPIRPFDDEGRDFEPPDRLPPQDVAAEQSVLGAMMLSKDAISEVSAILKPQDFYRPAHEQVYLAILDLFVTGEPADAVTVADELTKRGEIGKVGGHMYLHELLATVSIASNAAYYAEIVHEKAVLRRLVEAATRIAQIGYAGRGDVADIVDEAQQAVFSVGDGDDNKDAQPLSELIDTTMDEMQALERHDTQVGIPTGFTELDDLTNGLHPGQMIIIAARPALGKSTLALDFARAASIGHGLTTAFFSLEMTKSEIVMRLISAEVGIRLDAIRKGTLTDNDWSPIAAKNSTITDAPLFIDDSPNLSPMEIRSKARRLKQLHDLKLVVVDYLQLMTSGRRVENRQVEVSDFSRQMKLLAKELNVPVIALSQMNRATEQNKDKRPMLSQLRESGSLEQDADVVILLHREDFYDKANRPGEADLIVAKHRNGPTKTIPAAFQGHFSRFKDMPRQ